MVDKAITFFRANAFFRNFDIKSSVYGTSYLFYINVALKRPEDCRTLAEGTKAAILGLEQVPVLGEFGSPFPGLFTPPRSQNEAGTICESFFCVGSSSNACMSLYSNDLNNVKEVIHNTCRY